MSVSPVGTLDGVFPHSASIVPCSKWALRKDTLWETAHNPVQMESSCHWVSNIDTDNIRSRLVSRAMYLEKLKPIVIWDGGSCLQIQLLPEVLSKLFVIFLKMRQRK
jgi:hypothetical protein